MKTPEEHHSRARSFGAVAELYDRVRPGYPSAALEWALRPLDSRSSTRSRERGEPGETWRVADVGAGTGIMTRILVAAGYDVVAVEPDPQMRAQLAGTTPGALVLEGRAESIPLPDGGVDAAVAAQAYHWFDQPAAHAELARVIRPGGVFAAIWNDRDEETGWVADFTRIIQGARGPDDSPVAPTFGDGFSEVRVGRFPHAVRSTPDALVALLRSRSYYLTGPPERRAALEAEVRALTRDHPDLAGRAEFDLPYVTRVYRAVRH